MADDCLGIVYFPCDGLLYVCDPQADRIQVFNPDGSFVKEAQFARHTLGSGSAWDLAFSKDSQQKFNFKGMQQMAGGRQGTPPGPSGR